MQTLRKKSSPCKYKNEPARFLGDGMTFKAKLIGILEVNEARGDKMCQDALNDLKTAVRAAGEHKQRITISIAIDGLRLRDEKTGDSMYHHPVHKISFIAQDMSDSRAFGYIFGSPDTGHRFFGIKTDKTASQVVIAMRDLFQVVFELKKKEIEMAKHHIEQHQLKYGGNTYVGHTLKDDPHSEKVKPKSSEHRNQISTIPTTHDAAVSTSVETASVSRNSGAIADLLDLEDELNSIQQGISQMDRITPSDPFGPVNSKNETFLDSFKEKMTSESTTIQKPSTLYRQTQISKESSDGDKPPSLFGSAASTSSRAHFFPQFSPNARKSKEETYWFDQETESLFTDAVTTQPEPPTSPVTFHTPTGDPEMVLEERSPNMTDLFTDLDPLGTGKVRPYMDKKDFFQELKNPPKKVLKELLSETPKHEPSPFFPASFEGRKSPHISTNAESSVIKNTLANASSNILNSFPTKESKYSRIDPFEDSDPFEKTDPFLEESFPKSIGFPPLGAAKASVDVAHESATFRYDKVSSSKSVESTSPPLSDVFSSSLHGPLRVSLPPEKADTNTTISLSSIASRFRSSPSPTEDSKSHRRKHYQALKQSTDEKSDDQYHSPILEEVYMKGSPKAFTFNTFDRKYFIGSPPPARSDRIRSKMSSSLELLDATPDPPPKPKLTLFAIKPPPLPPKKQNQPNFRPPARPPSLEEKHQYDYLRHKTETVSVKSPSHLECSPKKKRSSPNSEVLKRQNSYENCPTQYPLLPPPPQRKTPTESTSSRSHSITTPTSVKAPSPDRREQSVLNITLNQLDQSGFESLASTLGIPTENVCNMTLQELTKMLAHKYLGSDRVFEQSVSQENDTPFQADFEANFGESSASEISTFDKYAVFKELIPNEPEESSIHEETERVPTPVATTEITHSVSPISEIKMAEAEQDKYAALRQLSLCAQKSENLSEELDISNEEDSSARADNISDIIKHNTDDSFTPLHNIEMNNDSPVAKAALDEAEEIELEVEKETELCVEEITKEVTWSKDDTFEHCEGSFDRISNSAPNETMNSFEVDDKNDWATFEKETAIPDQAITTETTEKCLENSPISSDGKDDAKDKEDWVKKSESGRRPVAWQDDDESWDEYSPKESYWSDESSHDGQSPVKDKPPSYHRKPWNKHQKQPKGNWGDSAPPWHRRWQDDTEDEYEDKWRRRRQRPSSFDRERKKEKGYEGYEKPFNWGREQWFDIRTSRGERRKPVEGGSDYGRRRCDSDASDKEYMNLDRNYPDPRDIKGKQYYGYSRDCQERHWSDIRESRSKYKKPSIHKRPSSASEAKRYEKIYSPIDHSPRSLDKSGARESEDDEYSPKFPPSRKDIRYHSNIEYYGSYDRRALAMHQRRMHRGKRDDILQKNTELVESPTVTHEKLHFFPPSDTPIQSGKSENSDQGKGTHFKFEDDFIPSPAERPSGATRKIIEESASDRRYYEDGWRRKVTSEESPVLHDNNNERYTNFKDVAAVPSKITKDKSKPEEGGIVKKPSLKGRNHFALMGRQDSSTSLRKSESINIFSRDSDPFEDDDFFSGGSGMNNAKLNKFFAEKSKSNTNVSDPFSWKDMFGEGKFQD